MDLSFLQGAGLFMCIGGIVLVGLLVLAVRAFTSAGRNATTNNQDVLDNRERGNERPTYDSRRVESSGGFGNESGGIPQTGSDRNRARVYDSGRDDNDSQAGGPLESLNDDDDQARRRDRDRRADDDDVRSTGGFGG